ncbi:MAG TPA: RNA polymerase sigma factor [Rhodocyclaceae bacterium]|jgi:RNA polymerase sigma-70 factor (ECF subfamily)|nr:RNA polymerase sigma factor [Rhodocyclaceae bacterium]
MVNPSEREVQALACLPSLRRYARALLGSVAAADDLVQDTLEKAWTRLSSWHGEGDIRAWLFSIMHNLHVDQVRKPRLVVISMEDEMSDIPDRARQGDTLALRDLDRALRKLPDEYREVLLLVALEEMSYAEAAEALGCPPGTVMSRLSRARAQLRVLLEAEHAALKVVR